MPQPTSLDRTPLVIAAGMFAPSAEMKIPVPPSRNEIEDVIRILESCKTTVVLQSNPPINRSSSALYLCAAFLLGNALIAGGSALLATESENKSSKHHSVSGAILAAGGLVDMLAFMVCCSLSRGANQKSRANLILTTDHVANYLEELSNKNKQEVKRIAAAISADLTPPCTLDAFLNQLKKYIQQYFPANSPTSHR